MADYRNANKEQGSSVRITLLILLIVALVAGLVAFGVWYWRQQEINRLNDRIGQLEKGQSTEINLLQDRIGQLEKELSTAKEKESVTTSQSNEHASPKGVILQVDTPEKNAKVTSPLKVSGKVPGTWSFEASFAVFLKDSNGNTIAQAPAQLKGEWMTTELVPFEATLTFTSPGSGAGVLVLQKNNPSGMPDKDDSVSIPVKF